MKDINKMIDKIFDMINPFLINLTDPIIKKIEKEELNPNKKINEAFGGIFQKIINGNINSIIKYINEQICKEEENIVNTVKENMTGFAIVARGKAAPIVSELLHVELPDYLKRKQHEFENIANDILETNLGNLGFTEKSFETDKIKDTLHNIINAPHIQNGLTHLIYIITKILFSQPLEMYLNIINIRNINDMVTKIEPLLLIFIEHIKCNISNEKIIEIFTELVKLITIKIMDKTNISELIENINLEKELKIITKNIIEDKNIIKELRYIIEDILTIVVKNQNFYDDKILKNDLEQFLKNSDSILEKVRKTGESTIEEILTGLNQALTKDTKDDICKYLINAIVNAIGNNFSDMVHTINISNVVEREINNMHPKQIEELFYSFAKDYFNKIVIYGWIGAFGVLISGPVEYLIYLIAKTL
jgi:uncharacterized membrane protein YheB (UPF0754 family)